jgi:hypothetical protein
MKKYLAILATLPACLSAATVINIDFSRDIVNGPNPLPANPAPVLYSGTGPAADAGTTWNDGQIALTGANSTVVPGTTFNDLTSSTGLATTIDIVLVSGFFRSFNGTASTPGNVLSLQNDRVFANGAQTTGNVAVLTVKGLTSTYTYDLYFINSGGFSTRYTVGTTSVVASGATYDGTWTDGGEYATLSALSPSAGEISIAIQYSGAGTGIGAIAGLQLVEIVPEPSSRLLVLGSLAGLSFLRRRPH